MKDKSLLLYGLLAALFLMTRLPFMPAYLEDLDSVNFALGLQDYDLEQSQPHFPGYPLFMVSAKLLNAGGVPPIPSLLLPGILVGALAGMILFWVCSLCFGRKRAWALYGMYLLNPLHWLESLKPLSEGMGYGLFAIAFNLVLALSFQVFKDLKKNERLFFISGILFGLLMGIRLSYMPLAASFLALPFLFNANLGFKLAFKQSVKGFLLGLGAWLIPFLTYLGTAPVSKIARQFIEGHFTRWGGTVLVESNHGLRQSQFAWDLLPNGLGLWWQDASPILILPSLFLAGTVIACAVFALQKNQMARTCLKVVGLFFIPYGLAIYFGQNLLKPRHVLPLTGLVLLIAAVGFNLLRENWAFAIRAPAYAFLILLTTFFIPYGFRGAQLAWTHRVQPSPAFELVQYVRQNYTGEQFEIFTGEEARLFEYYANHIPTTRVLHEDRVGERLKALPFRPKTILVTSKAKGWEGLKDRLVPVKSFKRDRYVHNHYHAIELYEYAGPESDLAVNKENL